MPEDGRFAEAAAVRLQRATGQASVELGLVGGATRLRQLYQAGSAKAFLPRSHGAVPEVVFLNTAGGLTGGDRLGFSLSVGAGGHVLGTTQTAERAYASRSGRAVMEVTLRAGDGAVLDWLPQETILFDGSTLARRTTADLAGGARLLLAEMVVLGRAAMGETVREVLFNDLREVRRDGQPVLVEPLRLTAATLTAGTAALGGARAFATVALIGRGAEDRLGELRALDFGGVESASSGWDGKLVFRAAGAGLRPVKQAVARVLTVLRGQPLPRVWQM